LTNGPYNTRFR